MDQNRAEWEHKVECALSLAAENLELIESALYKLQEQIEDLEDEIATLRQDKKHEQTREHSGDDRAV